LGLAYLKAEIELKTQINEEIYTGHIILYTLYSKVVILGRFSVILIQFRITLATKC
jgi:hypothetical protein